MDSQHRPHRKGLGWKQGTITYPDCPRLLSIILKWQCHQPFGEFCFISWIKPIWAPEKQAKMILLKDLFLRRYSHFFWQASPLKSKQMLGYVAIVHIYFSFYLVFSFKARRGLQRQNFCRPNSAESLISRISPPKRIFQQNHFSLFIRGQDEIVSWRKKMPKNLVTLPL